MLVNDRSLLLMLTTADGLTALCGYVSPGDIKPTIYRPILRPMRVSQWSEDAPTPTSVGVSARCYTYDTVHNGVAFYKERLDA